LLGTISDPPTCSYAQVVDPGVDFLREIAGDGCAVELGIGTGRIALPLSQCGGRYRSAATRSGA
jgi:hypothetical protein